LINAESAAGCSHLDLRIVDDQRSVDRHGERLPAPVELPSVQAARSLTRVDARVAQQIARVPGSGMGGEVLRRTDDRRAEILGHGHGHHVLVDELADLDACVKASGDEVHTAVVGGHVENDVRVVARELRELRDESDHRGASRPG
jgi:hypothetical protein